MKYLIIAGFAIMVLAQWIVPVKMIRSKQEVLKKGKSWLFKTEPVDPNNPFVGKYIRLNFEASQFLDSSDHGLISGSEVFVLLSRDSMGYAKIAGFAQSEPSGTDDFVKAHVDYVYADADSLYNIRIGFPFNEFYMEEWKAPKAETVYNEVNRQDTLSAAAKVKVWKGDAVTEDVLIDNKPISTYLKK